MCIRDSLSAIPDGDIGCYHSDDGDLDTDVYKRQLRPAPQGRGHRIRKRSNHVTIVLDRIDTVSYTHLDVYKRQAMVCS